MAEETTTATMPQAAAPEPEEQAGSRVSAPPAVTEDAPAGISDAMMAKLDRLPGTIRDYVFSDGFQRRQHDTFEKYGLDEDDRDIALFTVLHVLFGEIKLEEFPDALWRRISWEDSEEDKARQMASDLLGYLFLPVQAFAGDVTGLITRLGGDPGTYPNEAIEMRVISYDDATADIIKGSGVTGLDPADEKRLMHIIESRLRDVRDTPETLRMLMKPRKVGGLEMEEGLAEAVAGLIEDEMRMTKYVEESRKDASEEAGTEETPPAFSPDDIRQRLAGPAEEQKAVAMAIERLTGETGGNADVLRERLYDIVYGLTPEDPKSVDVVAVVLSLARAGGLAAALIDDSRFLDAVKNYASDKNIVDRLGDIEGDPASEAAMNCLLQMVLKGFGDLSNEDSARYGLRATNIMKKMGDTRYAGLVAFDMDKGEFVWTEPVSK